MPSLARMEGVASAMMCAHVPRGGKERIAAGRDAMKRVELGSCVLGRINATAFQDIPERAVPMPFVSRIVRMEVNVSRQTHAVVLPGGSTLIALPQSVQ